MAMPRPLQEANHEAWVTGTDPRALLPTPDSSGLGGGTGARLSVTSFPRALRGEQMQETKPLGGARSHTRPPAPLPQLLLQGPLHRSPSLWGHR